MMLLLGTTTLWGRHQSLQSGRWTIEKEKKKNRLGATLLLLAFLLVATIFGDTCFLFFLLTYVCVFSFFLVHKLVFK